MKHSTRQRLSAEPTVRTPAQVRAAAPTLDGHLSRVATAAADDGADPGPSTEDGTTGELWLYGVVGGWWRGFSAESVADALRGMDVDHLYVRLHSPGGYASDGIAIGNLLRNHRAQVTVVVDGLAASAASVIAVAGDHVVMCPGSQIMLHDASTFAFGNAAEIAKVAEWINGQSQNYAGVYQYRAGGTAQQWREVMLADTWYTAEGAVTAGLADTVGTVVAVGSPPTSDDDFEDEEMWARAAHDLEVLDRHVHPAARAAWRGEPPQARSRAPQPPSASAVGSPSPEGAAVVDLNDEQIATLREQVGFAENADADTIVQATLEALAERASDDTATTSATTAPEGYQIVPEAELATLRQGAEAGSRAAQQLHDRDREAFLDANRAKIPSSLRTSWAQQYDRDPAATRTALESMADIVPVSELGHNAEDDESTPTARAAVAENPLYASWEI